VIPITALFVLASATVTPTSVPGVELASAQARVEILRSVIVRQVGGLQDRGADTPRTHVNRRGGTTLIEFE
jgi:hypothetical protein